MQKLGQLVKERKSFPQPGAGGQKLPAHYFQEVALKYLKEMDADRKYYSRVMQAVKKNPQAAAVAFNETIRISDVTDLPLYFLDLFNRAAGSSKKL